ncbi:MAG: hypothetical protein WBA42_11410 [Mesorhizobium sp.]
MLRNLDTIAYLPVLSVRPAELVALRELPGGIHGVMLPHLLFRPWLGSGTLERAYDKVTHAYPSNAFILELDPAYEVTGDSSLAVEVRQLRVEANGYANWVRFCSLHEQVIPCIQVGPTRIELAAQISALSELGRGVAVRVPKVGLGAINVLLALFAQANVSDALFVIDFGETSDRYLVDLLTAKTAVMSVLNENETFKVALSSTSFPSSFTEISDQEIFERRFFEALREELPAISKSRLIYSDRGSARLPSKGGGGIPAPRIDLPTDVEWRFFRKDVPPETPKAQRLGAYKEMASKAVKSPAWDPGINIWGTQMIKLTELGSEFGITSPVRSTSARINIHLFRQARRAIGSTDTISMEDDWVDD